MMKLIEIGLVLLFSGVVISAYKEQSARNSSSNGVHSRPTETRTVEITDQTKGYHFNFFLALGCGVASAVVVLIFVVVLVQRYKRRRKKLLSLKREIDQPPCKPEYTTVPVQPDLKPKTPAGDQLGVPEVVEGYRGRGSSMNGFHEPEPKELRRKTVSVGPEGDTISIDDVTLRIWPGCLAVSTEIALIKYDQDAAFKSLLDLGLVDTQPQIFEFLPDGLKFLKPADLMIRYERTAPNSKMFLLHGSYNDDNQNVVWELVTNEIEEETTESVVIAKIGGFCWYSYFSAVSDMIYRILCHLNHSFPCCAYAFYRRQPPMNTIDISIVLVSSFIDKNKEEIKQLKDHEEEGYIKSDKGMEKCLCTDQLLEMCLTEFSGSQCETYQFTIDRKQLDKNGYHVDHFKNSSIRHPASGKVYISEVYPCEEVESLWQLNIHEQENQFRDEENLVQSAEPDPEPQVVYRTTRLSNGEINRLSNVVGVEWDSLAGLMNIPFYKREEIRKNNTKYPDAPLKAAQILTLYNQDTGFCRHNLAEHFDELGRYDWINEIKQPVREEHGTAELETQSMSEDASEHNGTGEVEAPPSPPEINANESLKLATTRLSSREMLRLSKRISPDWDELAGEMNIPREMRDDIRGNVIYTDNRSKAEKILSIFNNRKEFSREKLARVLENVRKPYLRLPVITGEWRRVHINRAHTY